MLRIQLSVLFVTILMLTAGVVKTASAQNETDEVKFNILRDEDSFTIIFTGTGEIPFHSIRIDVFMPDETITEVYLRDYSTFSTLNRRALAVPACLRFALQDADIPFPRACSQLTSQQRRVEEIGAIDVFWIEREIGEYYPLEIFQAEDFIGECRPDQVENEACELTFVPLAMPTQAPTRVTQVPPTSNVPLGNYPCDAAIVSNGATQLQVLYSFPGAAQARVIRAGTPVIVMDRTIEGGVTWYRLTDENGRFLGYVVQDFLVLSDMCPHS